MTSPSTHKAGITLSLIGIGCGDPEQLTLAAIRAINAADLILIPRKGSEKSELADLRRTICADVLTNDKTRVVEFDLPVRDADRRGLSQGRGRMARCRRRDMVERNRKPSRTSKGALRC